MKQDNKPITKKDLDEAVKIILNYMDQLLIRLPDDLETAREQNDPKVQASLQEAGKDIELKRTTSLEDLDHELGFGEEELGSNLLNEKSLKIHKLTPK